MATQITLSQGLYLQPDTAPYTSGSMNQNDGYIDGNRFTGGTGNYWVQHYSYGCDIGSSTRVDIIECYITHGGGDLSAWYNSSYDSVKVFKSDDGTNWTEVEQFDAPSIHYHAAGQVGFRLTLSTSQTARYFKVVCIDAALALTGGASVIMREIELYSEFLGYFEGHVYEESTAVSRTVHLYRRDTGALIDSTTSSGDGYYYLETSYSGTHYIIALDDPAGTQYNLVGLDYMVPATVS